MNHHISYQGNDETRGTFPVQFFEDAGGPPPPDTKATPRPVDRPRELPPSPPPAPDFQFFDSEGPARPHGVKDTPPPAGSGE